MLPLARKQDENAAMEEDAHLERCSVTTGGRHGTLKKRPEAVVKAIIATAGVRPWRKSVRTCRLVLCSGAMNVDLTKLMIGVDLFKVSGSIFALVAMMTTCQGGHEWWQLALRAVLECIAQKS
jgi:hypothetical protein